MYLTLPCVALSIITAMTSGAKYQEIAESSRDGVRHDWTRKEVASNNTLEPDITGLRSIAILTQFVSKRRPHGPSTRSAESGSKAILFHKNGKGTSLGPD